MQRYALFPEHANFSGIFFVKKGISGLSLTWVKGTGRAYILYIYAHGRDGQGEMAGTGGRRNPAAELRGTGRKAGGRDREGGREGGTGREETEDGGNRVGGKH